MFAINAVIASPSVVVVVDRELTCYPPANDRSIAIGHLESEHEGLCLVNPCLVGLPVIFATAPSVTSLTAPRWPHSLVH